MKDNMDELNLYDILISHEYSAIVREAFRKLGYKAMSCDLLPTEQPGPHYQGDVYDILFLKRWRIIIAHPECTEVCVAGNKTYGVGMPKHDMRLQAARDIEKFWNDCKKQADSVCFENPVGVLPTLTDMPKPQYIQPYQFGHIEQKKTGLYLYNLPELIPTEDVYDEMMKLPKSKRERIFHMSPGPNRSKDRSLTYPNIAKAFAEQWG